MSEKKRSIEKELGEEIESKKQRVGECQSYLKWMEEEGAAKAKKHGSIEDVSRASRLKNDLELELIGLHLDIGCLSKKEEMAPVKAKFDEVEQFLYVSKKRLSKNKTKK